MRMTRPIVLFAVIIAAGCATVGNRAVVTGAGADDLLKLRAGPGLGYDIVLGLPDGTMVERRGCVTEVGQRWCRVALVDAPRVSGFVSADYLTNP